MGVKCQVNGCPTNRKDDLQLHRFPKDNNLCTQWVRLSGNIKLLGKSSKQLREKHICSKHFLSYAHHNKVNNVGKRRIHVSGTNSNVPTLFLPPPLIIPALNEMMNESGVNEASTEPLPSESSEHPTTPSSTRNRIKQNSNSPKFCTPNSHNPTPNSQTGSEAVIDDSTSTSPKFTDASMSDIPESREEEEEDSDDEDWELRDDCDVVRELKEEFDKDTAARTDGLDSTLNKNGNKVGTSKAATDDDRQGVHTNSEEESTEKDDEDNNDKDSKDGDSKDEDKKDGDKKDGDKKDENDDVPFTLHYSGDTPTSVTVEDLKIQEADRFTTKLLHRNEDEEARRNRRAIVSKRGKVDFDRERKRLKNSLYRVQKQLIRARNRTISQKEARTRCLDYMKEHLSADQFTLFESQVNNCKKKPQGRRYSDEAKIIALTLYYRSSRAYNFLSQIFCLPTKKTLLDFLATQRVNEGFNEFIFRALKLSTESLSERQKIVVLSLDAINLVPEVEYHDGRGNINGLDKETKKPITQAMVVMARGMYSEYKQPIYYSFSDPGNLKAPKLKEIADQCLEKLTQCGLTVKLIICDQCGSNRSLFDNYYNVTVEKPYFVYNNEKVFCLYDTPHLFKSIRNNLQRNDLYINKGKPNEEIVSWKHIKDFYEIDKNLVARLATKIKHDHIYAKGAKLMRVYLATQIFSRTVAAAIFTYIKLEGLPKEAQATGKFIQRMNWLFDSLNAKLRQHDKQKKTAVTKTPRRNKTPRCNKTSRGQTVSGPSGLVTPLGPATPRTLGPSKLGLATPVPPTPDSIFSIPTPSTPIIRQPVIQPEDMTKEEKLDAIYKMPPTPGSPHTDLWDTVISCLKGMYFYRSKKQVFYRPPCLVGLAQSLSGISLLWEELKEKGYDYLPTGRLNQDPLENFFSQVRYYSGSSNDVTAAKFSQVFKTLMMTYVLSPPKNSTNCIMDTDKFLYIFKPGEMRAQLSTGTETLARTDPVVRNETPVIHESQVDIEPPSSSQVEISTETLATTQLQVCNESPASSPTEKDANQSMQCSTTCSSEVPLLAGITKENILLMSHEMNDVVDTQDKDDIPSFELVGTTKYASYICMRLLKIAKGCPICVPLFSVPVELRGGQHIYLTILEEASKGNIAFSSPQLAETVSTCNTLIRSFVELNATLVDLRDSINRMLLRDVDMKWMMKCPEHGAKLLALFLNVIRKSVMRDYIKVKNEVIKADARERRNKRKIGQLSNANTKRKLFDCAATQDEPCDVDSADDSSEEEYQDFDSAFYRSATINIPRAQKLSCSTAVGSPYSLVSVAKRSQKCMQPAPCNISTSLKRSLYSQMSAITPVKKTRTPQSPAALPVPQTTPIIEVVDDIDLCISIPAKRRRPSSSTAKMSHSVMHVTPCVSKVLNSPAAKIVVKKLYHTPTSSLMSSASGRLVHRSPAGNAPVQRTFQQPSTSQSASVFVSPVPMPLSAKDSVQRMFQQPSTSQSSSVFVSPVPMSPAVKPSVQRTLQQPSTSRSSSGFVSPVPMSPAVKASVQRTLQQPSTSRSSSGFVSPVPMSPAVKASVQRTLQQPSTSRSSSGFVSPVPMSPAVKASVQRTLQQPSTSRSSSGFVRPVPMSPAVKASVQRTLQQPSTSQSVFVSPVPMQLSAKASVQRNFQQRSTSQSSSVLGSPVPIPPAAKASVQRTLQQPSTSQSVFVSPVPMQLSAKASVQRNFQQRSTSQSSSVLGSPVPIPPAAKASVQRNFQQRLSSQSSSVLGSPVPIPPAAKPAQLNVLQSPHGHFSSATARNPDGTLVSTAEKHPVVLTPQQLRSLLAASPQSAVQQKVAHS